MKLRNKRILIVSPQGWDDGRFVSKHHYASELALRGNQVFFLGPPNGDKDITIKPTKVKHLSVISHRFKFNRSIRFHLRWLYDVLAKQHVRSINKVTGKIDIVWCFEPNLYTSLTWFNADFNIYHPVDIIDKREQLNVGNSADVIFSVADNILDRFNNTKTLKQFINHGLSKEFTIHSETHQNSSVKFAYIGNLMIKGLDRDRIKQIVINHPSIGFDFYGNYNSNSDDFISFLQQQNNTKLLGLRSTKELAKELTNYSGFILCYNPQLESNSGTNSHKILEYLSFGKVIVANKIYHYEKYRNLIQMSLKEDNSDYDKLFEETVSNLEKYNSKELVDKRKNLAFSNTYAKQIDRIEEFISKHFNFA